MANQFQPTGSLQEKMESRYKMPFKKAMQMLADRGMNRSYIAEEFSCSHATVVKHSLRLGVNFKSPDSFGSRKTIADNLIYGEFKRQLKIQQLNSINILYKKWCMFDV
jgi:hypothetical protein